MCKIEWNKNRIINVKIIKNEEVIIIIITEIKIIRGAVIITMVIIIMMIMRIKIGDCTEIQKV